MNFIIINNPLLSSTISNIISTKHKFVLLISGHFWFIYQNFYYCLYQSSKRVMLRGIFNRSFFFVFLMLFYNFYLHVTFLLFFERQPSLFFQIIFFDVLNLAFFLIFLDRLSSSRKINKLSIYLYHLISTSSHLNILFF